MIEKISIRRTLTYAEVLDLQKEEFDKRVNMRKDGIPLPGDVVFFVEHNPVYTLGLHGDLSHLLLSPSQLLRNEIEFFPVSRGGDITYHGPGQLTVYPIVDLNRYRLGVKQYVWLLEEAVMATIAEYGVYGDRIEGKTGVWIGKGSISERKISAIGIQCRRFVSMHGLALNVASDLTPFQGIVPCGLQKGVTSLSLEAGNEVGLDEVEEKLWHHLTRLLRLRIPSQEIL